VFCSSKDLHRSANSSPGRSASVIWSISSRRSRLLACARISQSYSWLSTCLSLGPKIFRCFQLACRGLGQELLVDGFVEVGLQIGTCLLHTIRRRGDRPEPDCRPLRCAVARKPEAGHGTQSSSGRRYTRWSSGRPHTGRCHSLSRTSAGVLSGTLCSCGPVPRQQAKPLAPTSFQEDNDLGQE
jgi:hypothetical protein